MKADQPRTGPQAAEIASGFANPEYLLTLTAIVIFLALVIPPIQRELQWRRNLKALGALRSAAARYAAETKTKGPKYLSDLAQEGRYLPGIPSIAILGKHPSSAQVRTLGQTDDSGGWTHADWPGSPREGEVWINFTHTDNRGKAWNEY